MPNAEEISDGFHTMAELYHHRAILFSVIVRDHQELAWKSKMHHDGTMYDGMFIVGIDTHDGQASYHYDIDPYWDMFDCKELENAPEFDGHTPAEAIERISALTLPIHHCTHLQKPLDLAEVIGRNQGCWLEDTHHDIYLVQWTRFVGYLDYLDVKVVEYDNPLRETIDHYGMFWRCWGSKPTEEEMRAAEWKQRKS